MQSLSNTYIKRQRSYSGQQNMETLTPTSEPDTETLASVI